MIRGHIVGDGVFGCDLRFTAPYRLMLSLSFFYIFGLRLCIILFYSFIPLCRYTQGV